MKTRFNLFPGSSLWVAPVLLSLFGTSLHAVDTDGDGLDDSVETNTGIYVSATDTGTDPLTADTDGDGLRDGAETNTGTFVSLDDTGTNPFDKDSDDDGAGDWYEAAIIDVDPANPQPNGPNDPAIFPNVPYPLPASNQKAPDLSKPIKVYILAGQSNMLGFGKMFPFGTPGTLETIAKNEGKFAYLLDGEGYGEMQNVYCIGLAGNGGEGLLQPGFGKGTTSGNPALGTSFGPELGFGQIMGQYHDGPILIIKVPHGNRSLGHSHRPTGSAAFSAAGLNYAPYGVHPSSDRAGDKWQVIGSDPDFGYYTGHQFDRSFLDEADWAVDPTDPTNPFNTGGNPLVPTTNAVDVLDDLVKAATPGNTDPTPIADRILAQWPGHNLDFQIEGFVWFQYYSDGIDEGYASKYEDHLVELIDALRNYYETRYPSNAVADIPFAIASALRNGWGETDPDFLAVSAAQLAVDGDAGNYPAYADNVNSVQTRSFYRPFALPSGEQVSPSGDGIHNNENAETFMLVGDSLGRAMLDLKQRADADTTGPKLLSISSDSTPTQVPTDSDFVLTFNEPITIGTGNITFFNLTDTTQSAIAITDATQVSADGFALTITPSSPLLANKTYAVQVDATAVEDASGNTYAGIGDNTTWTFDVKAVDTTAPPVPSIVLPATPITAFSITVSVTPVIDPEGYPIEYRFINTTLGTNSGWISDNFWKDTKLVADTAYSYTVQARDTSSNLNASAQSSAQSISTAAIAAAVGPALIYESFDNADGSVLTGTTADSGLGPWVFEQGGASDHHDAGSLSFNSLPTNGNRFNSAISSTGLSAPITADLSPSGANLLAEGTTLWMSVLIKGTTSVPHGDTSRRIGVYIGTDFGSIQTLTVSGGDGVGLALDPRGVLYARSTIDGQSADRASSNTNVNDVLFKEDKDFLFVVEMIWSDTIFDVINYYAVNDDLSIDPQPLLTINGDYDQANFDTVSVGGLNMDKYQAELDEIRIGASYEEVVGVGPAIDTSDDFTPPSPATMSFSSPPTATSDTEIAMTASAATDDNGVQYNFVCTSDGNRESGWQDSPTFVDTDLTPSTEYTYTVQARDLSENLNTNTVSAPASATTDAPDLTPPPVPSLTDPAGWTIGTGSIALSASAVVDGEGSGVEYRFTNTTLSTNSGWLSTPEWSESGLTPETTYTYTVQSRDTSAALNESAQSASESATTATAPVGAGGAIIYESFSQDPDATPENLIGTSGDTGLGNWRNGTIRNRNTGDLLGAGTSTFGTLSTAGNKFTPSFNDPSIAAPITAGDFSTLMADGNTVGGGTGLWMSALVTTRTNSNSDRLFIGIGDADVDARNIVRGNNSVEGGGAVGFFVNNGDDLQVLSWDAGGTRRNTNIEQNIATSTTHLVVMQFITGTTGNSDTLNFFFPGTDLVLPTASLTQTLDIDQSGFDRLLISNLDGTKFDADEIRIGASYDDVIGAGGSQGAYEAWAGTNAPTTGSDLSADEDGDGVGNGVEFIVGGSGSTHDLDKLPSASTDGASMTFSFQRAQQSIDPATTVSIEVGTDLTNWPDVYAVPDDATAGPPVTVTKDSSPGFDTVTLSLPMAPDSRRFARLRVEITP
jgi:hypothetical protein